MNPSSIGVRLASFCPRTVAAQTVNFEADAVGAPPAGWTCGVTGRGSPQWEVAADARARRAAPTSCSQIGQRHLPVVRPQRHVDARRLRRSEVQADLGQGGPGRRPRLALEGRRQLLRRARQRAGEQRLALLHRARQPQDDQVRRRAGGRGCLAHAARRVRRRRESRSRSTASATSTSRTAHIAGAGAVGVWTKADSVTAFDDFAYGAARR